MEAPRSLKRKFFNTPSRTERYGLATHALRSFEKRKRTTQWGAFENVRTALFPTSFEPKGTAVHGGFYHRHGNSVSNFSPSPRHSPLALPSSVGPPFSPLALFSSGRPPRQPVITTPSTVSSSSYDLFREWELEALRREVKEHREFRRGAMELAERNQAQNLKQTVELEMYKREVRRISERRDAEFVSSQLRDAGRPPAEEFQNLSRQTGGSNFSPRDSLRDISTSSLSGDVVVSVGGISGSGSQSDEVNVRRGSGTREDNQEPEWKQLFNKANSTKDKRTSLEKEIEYTASKLRALQLERPSGFKAEKKTEDKTLVDAFTPLSAEAELAVDEALGGGERHEMLVTHEKSNIDVTRGVMQCLSPGVWLNDEVINVYMELLKEREVREPERFLKCHFFNTFFYNKLYKDKRSYDYKAIRRWTTQKKLGYSLSDCDKILVPIHQDIHWCLAVINIRDKRLEYLDSLKGGDRSVLDVLARYIADEAKDKDGKVLDVSTWDQDFPKNIPEQLNGCDCGMFMVKYADFHSRGAPLQFTQENMEYFRRKMVWEILDLKAT